jgi:isopentenyl diphosphate isomerase/L-lactate dehydrogenase-like FMN-dependent dehydrogenase
VYGKDLAALDDLLLLPRVVHAAEEVDPTFSGLGLVLPGPLWAEMPTDWPGRISTSTEDAAGALLLAPALRMKMLVPLMREARESGAVAAGVDFSGLAEDAAERPRTREEIGELKAAAGLPFVVAGVLDPRDAELAVEGGADAVLACSRLSSWLGGPPLAQLVPDIRDIIGDTTLLVRGGLRGGADVVRYLALGADAVVVPGALNPRHLLAEVTRVMRVTGCRSLGDIQYDIIFEPTFE